MRIDRKEVEKVARLARLTLTEDEIETITPQLDKILEYVDKLNELDTSGVEPTSHVSAHPVGLREDLTTPSLSKEEALGNAPDRKDDFFRVPKIIG